MKKYPKIVQCDRRGQIVIPKDIRKDLKIDEGTGFWMFSITNEGILLKKIDTPALDEQSAMNTELERVARKANIKESAKRYKA